MTSAGIIGLGLWVPDEVRKNSAWPASFAESFHANKGTRRAKDFTVLDGERPYNALYEKFAQVHEADPFKGATERRVAQSDQLTVVGDSIAATRALEDARVDPARIDIVLSSALVQDRVVPTNGPAIQHRTGCVNAAGVGLESYCSSAVLQLDVAAAMVQSGRARYVLCVQSHQIARALDLSLPFSPMFGDGSAAFVVGPVPDGRGVTHVVRGGDGSLEGAVTFEYRDAAPGAAWYRDAAGPVHPGSSDLKGARYIGRHLLAFAIDTLKALSSTSGIAPDSFAAVCMMQPLVWFQPAVAAGLQIPADRVPSTYSRYAHLGGAGVVANLLEARERNLLRDGQPIALFAHGAGLTRFGALLRWHERKDA